MKKTIIVAIAIIASLFVFLVYSKAFIQTAPPYIGFCRFQKNVCTPIPQVKAPSDHLSYKGVNGKYALWILRFKEHALIEQDDSGLVVSINNRKADSKKHEYWAFYVNGKLAQVGPADYKTKDADIIEWKIEKY